MKILFLANRVPYPPYRGDKLKIYNLARRLQDRHELHLITFAQTEEDLKYKAELEKIFKEVHFIYLPKWKSAKNCIKGLWRDMPFQVLYFQSKEMDELLQAQLELHNYDAVHVQHLRMAPYLAKNAEVPRILDLPDAFSLYWERRKKIKRNFFIGLFENIEQRRLAVYERVIFAKYDLSLVCSYEDLEYLKKIQYAANLRLLPNGVDMETFTPGQHNYGHARTILFTGNMDYAPNVDAVIYFVQVILPLIRSQLPRVQFVIAGQRPVRKILELANDHITVTGFVKDLSEMYNSASVVVSPLRFGAGTQNKVLEAMAMGVPVVCSNIGFAGLGIKSGEGAVMQTEPTDFANSVIDILLSQDMRRNIGEAGTRIIRQRFDWDIVAVMLENYFKELLQGNKRSS